MARTSAQNAGWYYQRQQLAVGPITAEELRSLRDQGLIQRETLVLPAGSTAWLRAESLEFLFPAKLTSTDESLASLFNSNPLADFSSHAHALTLAHVVPDSARCVQCGICSFNCPMGIDVRAHAWRGDAIYDSHCLICTQCVQRCPRGVLEFQELSHYAES